MPQANRLKDRLRIQTAILAASLSVAIIQAASAKPDQTSSTLTCARKAYLASKLYATIKSSFAHWSAIPDFDLDGSYGEYLERAMQAEDRRAFDLITMEFVAKLHNGHTAFGDRWLHDAEPDLPFKTYWTGKNWMITSSSVPELTPGDIIQSIDDRPVEKVFTDASKYICASSDRAARLKFSAVGLIIPKHFVLTLDSGKRIQIDRLTPQKTDAQLEQTQGRWLREGSVAYIQIPSFGHPEFEQSAVNYVRKFASAKTLIIDVRNNPGGSTPVDLVKALMDRPYRWWRSSTSASLGLSDFYKQKLLNDAEERPALNKQSQKMSDFERGYAQSVVDSSYHALLTSESSGVKPDNCIFSGRLIILMDGKSGSAAEDFIEPFKDNHRAVLIGDTTMGTTGQPVSLNFGDQMFAIVSAKREQFPDGSIFEGVGITPDIEIIPTAMDLKNGRDPILEKAMSTAAER